MLGVSPAGSPFRAAGDGAASSGASSAPDKTLEANLVLASGSIYLFADYTKHTGISLATRILSLVSGKKQCPPRSPAECLGCVGFWEAVDRDQPLKVMLGYVCGP